MKETVAIVKCSSYDEAEVIAAVSRVFELCGGLETLVKKKLPLLLKPNFLIPDLPDQLSTTHPAILKAIIQLVQELGLNPVVGDRPIFGSAEKSIARLGLTSFCCQRKVAIIEFGRNVKPPLVNGNQFTNLPLAKEVLAFKQIINLPKLKAHGQVLLSLGVKNMFGCVSVWRRVWRHSIFGADPKEFARMLVATYLAANPIFTLVDGVIAMETKGPRGGNARKVGLLIGGSNAIAVDRVIMELLSLPWERLPTLVAAREMGQQGYDLSQIQVVGEALDQIKINDFQLPVQTPIQFCSLRSLKIMVRKLLR